MFSQVSVVAAVLLNINGSTNILVPDSSPNGSMANISAVHVTRHVTRAAHQVLGRVVRADGTPVTNAIVSVVTQGNTDVVFKTRTDSLGIYKINIPVEGTYLIRVICIGYTPVTLPAPNLFDDDRDPQDITMHEFITATQAKAMGATVSAIR